jgi:hypothetical protein
MKRLFPWLCKFILIPSILLTPAWFAESAIPDDIPTVPYLPLIQDVEFPPSIVRSGGQSHLFYELHLTSFLGREMTLLRVDVLDEAEHSVKSLDQNEIARRLVRAGKQPNPKENCVLDSGSRSVLFLQLSFENKQAVPDALIHRVTVGFRRKGVEHAKLCGVGPAVPVIEAEPLVIAPPVRPGIWLAGNGPGDGPVGHRLSLQAWNGRLVSNQRYALDFMKFGGDRRLVRGKSSINANWTSYGEEVLAVADGVVIEAKDGIVENTPGEEYAVPGDLDNAAGNRLVLKIGPDRYAAYAHLKPHSLRVKTGDQVRKGQALGLIGNSGISDAPHLHFHLINAASFFGGESIPYLFEYFDLLGPYQNPDEQPDKAWSPQSPPSRRHNELPIGDGVIRFF